MVRRMFLSAAAAGATDWPGFRGLAAAGVGDGTKLPVHWDLVKGTGVAWRTALVGMGHSSPVAANGRVYLTAAVSSREAQPQLAAGKGGIGSASDVEEHRWLVIAIDEHSGKILWERVAATGSPRIKRHVKASHANASCAANATHVAAFFGSEGLYVFDTGGRLLWKKDLGVLNVGLKNENDTQWGFASSPLMVDRSVVVQCDTNGADFVAAFDLQTGRELWRSEREEYPSWSTPILLQDRGGPQIVTVSPRFTRGLDAKTGKELWRFADETEVRVSTPILADGLLIVSDGYPQGRPFFALRANTLPRTEIAWRVASGGPYTTTPLAYGGLLYVLSDQGVLGCYETATGKQIYRQRVPEHGGSYSASPVAGDGKIYLASEDGDVHVLKAGPKLELLASHSFGSPLFATPAIANGRLLVRSQEALYALLAV